VNSNQKKSSKISGFFNKLFASLKFKRPSRISAPASNALRSNAGWRSAAGKRAVFFVFLAVFVLGFSLSIAHAALTNPPKPGTPYAQWPDEWKNAPGADTYKNSVAPSGTNNSDYRNFLISTGGYSQLDASRIALQNPNLGPSQNDPIASIVSSAATKLGEGLLGAIIAVVCGILAIIAYFCKLFLMFAGWTLDFTLNPNLYNFTSNTMIVQGWTIVRDVCNLFFLLVLLFIAICTILKIEKYHAKKTLLMLIIMALLINFSKPIAIFIFDGSQLLMGEFLKQLAGNSQSPSTMYAQASSIAKFMYDDFQGYFGSNAAGAEIAVQYLFIIIFLFMFAVALFVMALFLIIRIVVIMLLIIVSPLAFFAAIIPDFSKMSSKWWSSLFEYSFYGPAAAFFLLLATKLSNVLTTTINPQSSMPGMSGNITQHMVQYFVVLVFLYASIIMAKQFGLQFSDAIIKNADKFMKWGAGMTKTGGVWGAMGRTTGVTGGVSQRLQQSGLTRWMTKEGRKRNQKTMEARVAGVLGVTGARTKRLKEAADDLKNESNTNIQRMAAGGDMVAAYVASNRGILNDGIVTAIQPQLARDADMRNEFVRNARKNGQAHQALNIRLQTAGLEEGAMHNNPAAIAANEINRVATSDLVKNQNINDLAQMPHALAALITAFDELNNRLTIGTPAQREAAQEQLNRIISEASAQNLAALSANRPTAPGGPRPIMT
jgi:hypothetical protein